MTNIYSDNFIDYIMRSKPRQEQYPEHEITLDALDALLEIVEDEKKIRCKTCPINN